MTPQVIKLTNEFNMMKKKVQGIIVFTTLANYHLSKDYPKQYKGLVLGVATHFETLTKLFNEQVKKVEEEKREAVNNSN